MERIDEGHGCEEPKCWGDGEFGHEEPYESEGKLQGTEQVEWTEWAEDEEKASELEQV